jgi:catechol 2,3-dioxygenase-like lactoylglutathione lyase family enzyme
VQYEFKLLSQLILAHTAAVEIHFLTPETSWKYCAQGSNLDQASQVGEKCYSQRHTVNFYGLRINMMDQPVANKPVLDLDFLSHGTVECSDLEATRRFYTEVLGMEVVQTSAVSLMMRLNSVTTVACVQGKAATSAGLFNHFGFDVATKEMVDAAYEQVKAVKDKYGIKKITKPVQQHGTYSFYIIDLDENWWEILENPKDGYSYVFDIEEETDGWREQNHGTGRREKAEVD